MTEILLGIIGGCGHIGLIHAACLASLGYTVVAYDSNTAALKNLAKGIAPFYEPGLQELLHKTTASGVLTFTGRINELHRAGLVYVCVGTPSLADGRADTGPLESAVQELAGVVAGPAVAAIKSTVPVGTARKISRRLAASGLAKKLAVVSNPEFLAEGTGISDFLNPSRVIAGGEDAAAVKRAASIYAPPGVPVITTTWENAELIKYAANAFLAAKLSLINEIAALCEQAGADIRLVGRGTGLDPRIGASYLEAGAGFGGPCLEKDLRALISQFDRAALPAPLLEAVLAVNRRQCYRLVQKLSEKLGSLEGKKIGVLGLAFKPGTDDVRGSPSLPVIRRLLALGALVAAHDPAAGASPVKRDRLQAVLPGLTLASSPYEAAAGKDGLLILTAWPEYKKLDPEKLKHCLAVPLIVDGRNLFDPAQMRALGIDYRGVGR